MLADARAKTDKCLLGGIREVPYFDKHGNRIRASPLTDGTVDEVERHVREAIDAACRHGLILGSGCVAGQLLQEKNIYALRRAVNGVAERVAG